MHKILNGKAKEEFFNWLDNQGVNGIDISNWEFEKFHLLSNVSQNSLIIEWFDSVGIYINTTYEEYEDIQVKNLPVKIKTWSVWIKWINELLLEGFSSRQEALTEAIKKANEIYNNKN